LLVDERLRRRGVAFNAARVVASIDATASKLADSAG